MPRALELRPRVSPVMLQYVQAFSFLREFRNERNRIEMQDMFLYAKQIGDDPINFAKIIFIAHERFLEAIEEKNNGIQQE